MNELFQQLSDALADTVAAAAPGIVRVSGRKRLAATGMIWREGVIVTASHVLRRDEGIVITMHDGRESHATLAGRDPSSDIAVLRVEGGQPLPLAAVAQAPRVGHLALALGRPGEAVQATLGIVSAVGTGRMQGAIQTDVVMYPGFSGGPLITADGLVQGMNTSGFARGISVAVSTARVDATVETLLAHGRMRQGFLGIGAQPVRLPDDVIEASGQETGLILVSVEKDSPAASGGLVVGDIIVSLDGVPTPDLDALISLLTGERVGREVPLAIVRGGQQQTRSINIGEKL